MEREREIITIDPIPSYYNKYEPDPSRPLPRMPQMDVVDEDPEWTLLGCVYCQRLVNIKHSQVAVDERGRRLRAAVELHFTICPAVSKVTYV